MAFLSKKALRLLARKIYFSIYNSPVFDFLNHAYFRLLFAFSQQEISKRCRIYDSLPGERILILAPHIDDEIIGCGGAILTYLRHRKDVFIAYLTDSQKQGSKTDAREISAERREEAFALAAELGIKNLFFLDGKDGDLLNSPIEEALLKVVREVQPDTVFLPVLLDTHSDHYAATKKLNAAYSREPEAWQDVTLFLYESQSPITLFHANVGLRITDVFPRKLELLSLFKSQPYSFKFVGSLNRINGLFLGAGEKCETFISVDVKTYYNFTTKHFSNDRRFLALKQHFKPNKHSGSLIPSYLSSRRHKEILQELTGRA